MESFCVSVCLDSAKEASLIHAEVKQTWQTHAFASKSHAHIKIYRIFNLFYHLLDENCISNHILMMVWYLKFTIQSKQFRETPGKFCSSYDL